AAMDGQIPEAEKSERLARLQELILRQTRGFNRSMIGRDLPVLFEKRGRHEGQLVGRSPYLQAVHAAAPLSLIGGGAPVTTTDIHSHSLAGRRTGQPRHRRSARSAIGAVECTGA